MRGVLHRDRFIEMANRADEAHEAYAFTRLALMFAESHERRSAVKELFTLHDLLLARTVEGNIVLPLYMDHGYWTAEVSRAEAEISASAAALGDAGSRHLLVSGQLSTRAMRELESRGWGVVEGLEELWLSPLDLARFRPEPSSQHRILPEFGL
jgi:hypothetical protein